MLAPLVRRLRIALGALLIDVGVRVTSAGERMLPAAPRTITGEARERQKARVVAAGMGRGERQGRRNGHTTKGQGPI